MKYIVVMYHGLDTERTLGLVAALERWSQHSISARDLVNQAELLADEPVGVTGTLDEITTTGRSLAQAILTAHAMVTSFQLQLTDPRRALLLDLGVGATYDPAVAHDALVVGETYRQAELRHEFRTVLRERPSAEKYMRVIALMREYVSIDPATNGDPGGTFSTNVRTPFRSSAADEADAADDPANHIVAEALRRTGDLAEIHDDEFGVIFHDNGHVTLVLPGVIDLTEPHLGYDPKHRSARDFDQAAIASARDHLTEHNPYANLVSAWVHAQVDNGTIAQGAPVLIVGHSFGADTALDLAADPEFNGPLVNVTHVVPAGYYSQPQLPHVVNDTHVLVLQNIYDPVVGAGGVLRDLDQRQLNNVAFGINRLNAEVAEEALSAGAHIVNHTIDAAERLVPLGIAGRWLTDDDDEYKVPDIPTDIELWGDEVTAVNESQFIVQFEGGIDGFGHGQDLYVDFLTRLDHDPRVTQFLTSVSSAGFDAPGSALAVDVSMPDDD